MSRQPPDVLAAWIQDSLDEIQSTGVRRLMHVCQQLQADVFQWDNALLAQALADTNLAGRELSFLPLRQGWLARLRGRHRAPYATFTATHARIVHCASQVKTRLASLAAGDKHLMPGARGALAELRVELQELNADIDQAVTWLQGLCTQLAEARASGRDDRRLETLAEQAQRFTQEFKRLQSASTMLHDIALRGSGVVERRKALLEQTRVELEGFDEHWMTRVGALVAGLSAGRDPIPAIPKAIEAHDDFMKRLAASVDACGALQHEEALLAQHLGMLHEEFEPHRH